MLVVGLLSGTSVDGIDVVVTDFQFVDANSGSPLVGNLPDGRHFSCTLVASETVSWPPALREHILYLCTGVGSVRDVCIANFSVGEEFARAVNVVLEKHGIDRKKVPLIGSHGQTIWHEVQPSPAPSSASSSSCSSSSSSSHRDVVLGTLQIGEAAVIAERTGITVVSNFRVRDVSAGGHGAPLTSTLDWTLLRGSGWRALQNIGGIGNVTLLPPRNAAFTSLPIAFDTGPGNALIDYIVSEGSKGMYKYDKDGERARKGKINNDLVSRWLSHPYFSKSPPKTTGRELFGAQYARKCEEEARSLLGDDFLLEDLLCSLTELTARSIALSYSLAFKHHITQGEKLQHLYVSGGGARNVYLMERIRSCVSEELGYPVPVTNHDDIGIDSDSKEGVLFALLAFLCVHNVPGNVPSCTGAVGERVLGTITPGNNFSPIELINM